MDDACGRRPRWPEAGGWVTTRSARSAALSPEPPQRSNPNPRNRIVSIVGHGHPASSTCEPGVSNSWCIRSILSQATGFPTACRWQQLENAVTLAAAVASRRARGRMCCSRRRTSAARRRASVWSEPLAANPPPGSRQPAICPAATEARRSAPASIKHCIAERTIHGVGLLRLAAPLNSSSVIGHRPPRRRDGADLSSRMWLTTGPTKYNPRPAECGSPRSLRARRSSREEFEQAS
jgi:hypothetical protein